MHATKHAAFLPALLLGILAVGSASCVTSRSSAPANLENAAPRHSRPTAAWILDTDDARAVEASGSAETLRDPLGYLVRFESLEQPDRFFFSVRNAWQQELGLIDHAGRAYRFQPHGREAEWVGTGTVEAGARTLLDAPKTATLREIELAELR